MVILVYQRVNDGYSTTPMDFLKYILSEGGEFPLPGEKNLEGIAMYRLFSMPGMSASTC